MEQLNKDKAAAAQQAAACVCTGGYDTGDTPAFDTGGQNMGENREGRAAALLPILIFLLIFLRSRFITGDFYSMPAIVAFLIALLAG